MAGRSDQSTDSIEEPEKIRPIAKNFSCTNCGASVTIRYPGASLSVVCDSCKALIDTTTENYKILSTYHDKTAAYSPLLELGTRGNLFGKEWEVIGFLTRCDVASLYSWEEYLLFNPYYGYRWLTHNGGHWSFVCSIKEKPVDPFASVSSAFTSGTFSGARIRHGEESYAIFYRGEARVAFVLGEFYWKVKVGESVAMSDYICPPRMLSSEVDGTQLVWSISEYVAPKVVEEAFKLSQRLPVPSSVAPNQPSELSATWKQVKPIWIGFLVLITALQIWHVTNSANLIVFEEQFPYVTNSKSDKTLTTKVFEIPKAVGNVEIKLSTPVDNSWFYTYVELVNDETGETKPFEKTIEYYHGYTDGESWSEGSTHQDLLLYAVPGGKYYMNIDTESGGYMGGQGHSSSTFIVEVKNDVATWENWIWCVILLTVWPVILWGQSYGTEAARWSDSDYSPFRSSSSDD